jgi:undecaprenyl-diphosphatase
MSELSYLQAATIGVLQGVTELFPVSSLGHSVLVPALIGGSWAHLVIESAQQSSEQSSYLAFIVGLHVATAIALLAFYWRDWVRIITGVLRTLRTRRVETSDERLGWLIIIATIPVGITGLALEHEFRVLFAKPLAAAIFLTINGVILLAGERLRRRATVPTAVAAERAGGLAADPAEAERADAELAHAVTTRDALQIGSSQILALFAGISRSGVTMVTGLWRGLDHEQSARFAFLLATPVILAAGVLKLPTLAGSAGNGIRGQVLVGSIAAGFAAYLSVRFLTRYFQTRTLTPFAIYCLVVGIACIVRFA